MKAQEQVAFLFAVFALGGMTCDTMCERATADTFGSGDNVFDIPFVTIGDPGNAPDTTTPHPLSAPLPTGSVAYEYRIGKYEIPEEAIRKANAASALDGNPLGLTLDDRGLQKPATRISWFEAARFVNWLNEEKGHTPAYKFNSDGDFQLWISGDAGYNPANPFRNTLSRYFLPSADEWYKAAFYDPATGGYWDFPNGSNDAPTPVASGTDPNTAVYNLGGPADILQSGGPSPFGTIAQAGNVWEWEETAVDLVNDDPNENRGFRGSAWLNISGDPTSLSSSFRHFIRPPSSGGGDIGFRIASIPEPSAFWLIASVIGLFSLRRPTASSLLHQEK